MSTSTSNSYLKFLLTMSLLLLLWSQANHRFSRAAWLLPSDETYPLCRQLPLTSSLPTRDEPDFGYVVYLPLILKPASPPPPPACTVYCGLALADDPYRPAGYRTYFAEEFDCNQLLTYWTVQPQMTPASYVPPATGQIDVSQGSLKVGVPGWSASFPYLYMVDNAATSYDVSYKTGQGDWVPRIDWVPDAGDFRLAMRVRFEVEMLGEHRIALYADGHRPEYAGPLFYIGSDYNDQEEAWRGLVVGADRGHTYVDLGDYGYEDPYTDWVVLTVDFNYSTDDFVLAVDGVPRIRQPLSSFTGYPEVATRPDTFYLGSLARLQEPVPWTDIDLDWIRVYAPETTPPATFGLLAPKLETSPSPTGTHPIYSSLLPAGPFHHSPHWSEDFMEPANLDDWQLVKNPDPANAWTEVITGQVALRNNGDAIGVPVWAIFDDMLPPDILSAGADGAGPLDYLHRRGGSPVFSAEEPINPAAVYPRTDWRPNGGNVRYAWRGRQTANGYGVEISNAGHFPFFTGAMFYTLQDTTTPGGGQFILPACQEQYFWRLHRLSDYAVPHEAWTVITADYINGTVHIYVDGQEIGWWPESDCSLNWYLKGENATSPDVLFFGNPATAPGAPGCWSELFIDWFATFPGLPRLSPL